MNKVTKLSTGEYSFRGYLVTKSPEKCSILNKYQWDVACLTGTGFYEDRWCQRFDTKRECLEWIDLSLSKDSEHYALCATITALHTDRK